MRPFGRRSYWLAAATLPVIVIEQLRGIYVALPLACLLVWVLSRSRVGVEIRRGLAITLGVGIVAASLVFTVAPEGRLGKVTPTFFISHFSTLLGREGPSAGTVDHREQWLQSVLGKITATETSFAFGLGLGPDLAEGFKAAQVEGQDEALVRKPHNDYLEILARYGLLGFATFTIMLGSAFMRIVGRARRLHGLEARFLWFAFAQSVVYAFLAATQPYLAFPWGTVPLFLVLGAALAVAGGVNRDIRHA